MQLLEKLKGMLPGAWAQTPKTQRDVDIANVEKIFKTHFAPFFKQGDVVCNYDGREPPSILLVKNEGTSSLFIVVRPEKTEVRASYWDDAKNFAEISEFRLKPSSQMITFYEQPADVVDVLKRCGHVPAETPKRSFWHS